MLINGERAMAYVVKIDDLLPIEGADRIECAKVGGWNVVAQKELYKVGDLAIYCEIDSWIPHGLAPFLTQDGHYPKVYNEVEGQRLKTKKLKGVVSQGLLLPLFYSSSAGGWCFHPTMHYLPILVHEGEDVTERLGIQKWERPIPAELRGVMKGNFPSFIPKTDQERCQNLTKQLPSWYGKRFEVTEKLHGSSMTVYITAEYNVGFGVCSRNIDLKESDTNTYWKVAKEQGLLDVLLDMWNKNKKHSYALQGELIGEGINGNMYNIKGHQFKLFDIYDITEGRYLTPVERADMWLRYSNKSVINTHVPVVNPYYILNHNADELLHMVQHKSRLNPKVWAEGWVLKCNEDPTISFKVVSNKFLTSKEGEDA
jgi:RNA ligase (TIGR02306 family)